MSTASPLHTLVLAYDYPPAHDTGMGTQIHELVRGLGRAGWRSTVLVPDRLDIPAEALHTPAGRATWEADNVTVHRLPPSAATQALASKPDDNAAALLMARNADLTAFATSLIQDGLWPDLLHCHDFFLVPTALRLKYVLGIPLVVTVHMLFEPLLRWWGETIAPGIFEMERLLCRKASAIITVSHSMAEVLATTHGLPAERVHVVHNGFDLAAFAGLSASPQPGAPDDDIALLRERHGIGPGPVVFYAGRIARQKGIRELLQSAAQVLAHYPQATYVLAGPRTGEPAYQAELQRILAGDPLLRDRVRFLGKVPRPELARLYRLADVVVVPSLYEPFGYAATEAMAAGAAVVATRAGGLAEIVEHGRSGLLVATASAADGTRTVDVDELAAAQLTLLRDPALARQLGQNAQARVRAAFSLDRMLAATAAVYHHVHHVHAAGRAG